MLVLIRTNLEAAKHLLDERAVVGDGIPVQMRGALTGPNKDRLFIGNSDGEHDGEDKASLQHGFTVLDLLKLIL